MLFAIYTIACDILTSKEYEFEIIVRYMFSYRKFFNFGDKTVREIRLIL